MADTVTIGLGGRLSIALTIFITDLADIRDILSTLSTAVTAIKNGTLFNGTSKLVLVVLRLLSTGLLTSRIGRSDK